MKMMFRRPLGAFFVLAALALCCAPALAQSSFPTPGGSYVDGHALMCPNGSTDFQGRPVMAPCGSATEMPSVTGTTGALTVTLPATVGKTQWFCGFAMTSGGTTTAASVNATVAGLITGTANYVYVFPSSGQGVLGVAQPQCTPASGPNVAITITVPGGGAGTLAALTAWGTVQ